MLFCNKEEGAKIGNQADLESGIENFITKGEHILGTAVVLPSLFA